MSGPVFRFLLLLQLFSQQRDTRRQMICDSADSFLQQKPELSGEHLGITLPGGANQFTPELA